MRRFLVPSDSMHGREIAAVQAKAREVEARSGIAQREACEAAAASIGLPWLHFKPEKVSRQLKQTHWEMSLAQYME